MMSVKHGVRNGVLALLAAVVLMGCAAYSDLTGVRVPCQYRTTDDAYSGETWHVLEPCPIHSAERLDWSAPFLLGLAYRKGGPGFVLTAEVVEDVALFEGLGIKIDGAEHNLSARPLDTDVHIGAGEYDLTRSRGVFVVSRELLTGMVAGERVLVQLRTTRRNLVGDFAEGCSASSGTPCAAFRDFLTVAVPAAGER